MTMILRCENGQLKEVNSYRKALHLEEQKAPILSVVGAGGKTTTIFHLAEEYRAAGIPVIVTTTTHMKIEDNTYTLLNASVAELKSLLETEGMVQVGIEEEKNAGKEVRKMKGVSREFFDEICAMEVPILIEADGAKRLPCKVPAEWEPVILPETTHVISVYGLDAVGKPIGEICFRPELAAEFLEKSISDKLEPKDIATLAVHVEAGRKAVGERPYYILLNKADDEERMRAALEICRELEIRGCTDVLVTSDLAENKRKTERQKNDEDMD